MEGVYIGKSRGIEWASISVLLAIASAAAAIFAGPVWVGWLSGAGLFLALAALWKALRAPSLEKPTGLPSIMIGVHALLLVTAAVLQSMFLSPLPPAARKIPVLQKPYVDPNGVFRTKGPVGWDFRPVPSSLESGVRMQPADKSLYMGVSEVTVFVRRLDKRPPSPEEFLKRAAASFSERRGGQELFDLRTEKGLSLRNEPVMWSELTVKRFWVPVYQVSVFGVKSDRYLCSVSATGLKSHAALSKLLCLGLFDRITVTGNP